MLQEQSVTILLVEDDHGHARLIEKNLQRMGMPHDIVHLDNGEDAITYLGSMHGANGQRQSVPLLVLLDLNLPGLDGYEVLTRLKTDGRTRHIPVIMLTTTDDPREIERCYALGCNVYLTKPVEYTQFAETIRSLGLFLSAIKLPLGDET